MADDYTPWQSMTLAAKWKHTRGGDKVPVSLEELDRLEKRFGGSPSQAPDTEDASLFWERAVTRPFFGAARAYGLTHVLFLRGAETAPE